MTEDKSNEPGKMTHNPQTAETKKTDAKKAESQDSCMHSAKDESGISKAKSCDDNIVSAIAHAMILILPVLTPLIIWLVYKDKSESVRFQSMQALIYQFAVMFVFFGLVMVGSILSFLLLPILLIFVGLGVYAIGILYGLWAAYKCFSKEQFKYPYIADLAKKHC